MKNGKIRLLQVNIGLVTTILLAVFLTASLFVSYDAQSLFSGMNTGLLGLFFILAATRYWGLKGGVLSAVWATGIIIILGYMSNIEIQYIASGVATYLLIGIVLGRLIDVNRKNQVEIRKEKNKYLTLFENSGISVIIHNKDTGEVVDANPKAIDSYGFSDLEELKNNDFWHDPPYSAREALAWIHKAAAEGPQHFEWLNSKKNGKIFWEEVRLSKVVIDDAERIMATCIDITERRQAEDALRRSEEKLRQITENMDEVFWLRSADNTRVLYISPAYVKIWGRTCESLYENPASFVECVYDEDKPTVFKAYEEYLKTSVFDMEYRILRPDGEIRWVHARSFPVKNNAGEITGHTGIATDISERILKEQELAAEKWLMDKFFRQSLHGFFLCMLDEPIEWNDSTDKDKMLEYVLDHQRMTRVNRAMLDQYGATEKDFIGITVRELFQHDLEHAREIWRGLFDRGRWHVDTFEKKMDGTPMVIDGDYICLYDDQGRITGHFGVQVDITEQKQIQAEIKNARDQYRSLVENIPGITFRCKYDKDWTMLFMSDAVESLCGYPAGEFIGNTVRTYESVIHREDTDFLALSIQKCVEKGEPWDTDYRIVHKDGSICWVHEKGRAVYDGDGSVLYLNGVIIDITEQKRAENERKLAEEEAKKSEQRLNTLISQTPAVIYSYMFRDGGLKIVYVNENVKQVLGFEPEDFINNFELFNECLHPEDAPAVFGAIPKLMAEGSVIMEYRFKDRQGNYRWLHDEQKLITNEDGSKGAVGAWWDNTDRKQAEIKHEKIYRQLEKEVNKAAEVHRVVLPETILQTETISIAAHYQPATLMGGDSYNVIKSDNKLIIYLADVMGHGLDGAMISVFTKEAIDSYVSLNRQELYPQKILQHLNRQYRRGNFPEEQLICILLGVIDLDTHEFKYSSAGFQTKPLARLGNGEKKKLETGGLFISNTLPTEILTFKEQTLTMTPGTTILMATDGLTEQKSGEKWFMDYYEEIFYKNSHLPPEMIVGAINRDFYLFNRNSLIGNDDITYLVLQMNRDKKEKHHLEIAGSFEEIPEVNDKIDKLTADFPNKINLATCLHELVVNAIEHGNKFDENKKVTIDLTITPGYVLAEVEDEGEGFDWCAKIEKPVDMEGYAERGRGISLLGVLSGNLFYNSKGNKATLLIQRYKAKTDRDSQ